MNISATIIAKMIEAHEEHDDQKFHAYAGLVLKRAEEDGDEVAARVIRKRLDGTWKQGPFICTLDENEKQ